ncbi:MAG: cytochrome C oxidase subunit IV family protein [Firmicutes bacterium]|nr:cytochrome C oxidase subunit IV family protein [Alicyclobacillaceae bacterium]MCL6497653.1 cytochrome C oxidase subunit IV family protein [Bacillota bacterium]
MASGVEHKAPREGGHTGMYVAVGVGSLVLTAIAFYVVFTQAAFRHVVIPVILVLAAIQVFLQTWLFMHLNTGRRSYQTFFAYGVFLALVVVLGSVQVMTSYKPPMPVQKPLTHAQLLALGQQIVSQQCVACHTVNGQGATIGPNLNLVMEGKVNVVPGGQPTNPAWLARWISDPAAVWSGAKMPDLNLSSQQVQGVVDYLTSSVK